MDLNIKDISHLLMVSEKEIQQMIKKKEIPHQYLQDKVVFNKHQIIEWALGRNLPINVSGHHKFIEYKIETVSTLLDKNTFHYNCELTKSSYIEQMISQIKLEKNVDREIIIQLLKSRESLMSTAIGNGISLPHPRVPLMVGKNKPLIDFFFPQEPLELNSVDGKPIHTLILLISQTIKQHLSLIAHLSFLLSKETFRFALENRLDYNEIIDIITKIEETRN
ncbi:PTS sugar transporter subunit IIA [Ignavibacterium sp.]|jgi:PTS system nitrogen regulatory IIA component|uniref:PTS sugar transporter subunit IIA n=1 Tax=Ignavibacterium sp. TaxID=2651167 RepID=UPI0025C52819|nr:PTS sugar transporter subunit IIA [Ignavibacterium sp.]